MNASLKSELATQGFTVIPEFLSPRMLEDLRKTSAGILENLSTEHREKFRSTGSLCNFGDHPEYAELVALDEVQDVMTALGYASFKWLAGYLISKPGVAPPLFWHQDWWGWAEGISYEDRPLGLGFMYYLSDTSPENGCLRVIPGTHRKWHELHGLDEAHGEELGRAKDVDTKPYQSHPDEVAVKVKAGDLVVMDSRLLHSAYANSSGNERSLLTLWYMPDYEAMPAGVRVQFEKIFARTDLDIDAGESRPVSPLDWPETARSAVANLFPKADAESGEVKWQRAPDMQRMQP